MGFGQKDERGGLPRKQAENGRRKAEAPLRRMPCEERCGIPSEAPVSSPPAWREEAWLYAESIGLGLVIGFSLIMAFLVLAICAPMMLRRNLAESGVPMRAMIPREAPASGTRMSSSSQGSMRGSANPGVGDDGMASQSLPQVDWGDILTEEERANMGALRQDIRSMLDSPQFNVFAWPVLPYPVTGISDWDSRFDNFSKLLDGVYNEEPELSVYTNGQNTQIVVVVAKYHLGDAEGATPTENLGEYRAVTQAADQLDSNIQEQMSEIWCRWHVDAGHCSEDELYAMLLYRALGSQTTYSDGIDDTIHENDIYGALIEGESKCYGMASATKALLNRRGIPSFMSSGSVDGDDEQRHAWVTLWIDGQWKVLDLTYSQGIEAPGSLDVEAGTSGQAGYWGGCLKPYREYVESRNTKVDQVDIDLMAAYERRLASVG